MAESRTRFEEGIELVTRLWTEDRVTHEGRFHRLRDVHLQPRPVQQPHPPVWIASIASEESFVWAGRHGYNVMIVPTRGAWSECAIWSAPTARRGATPGTHPDASRCRARSTATWPGHGARRWKVLARVSNATSRSSARPSARGWAIR